MLWYWHHHSILYNFSDPSFSSMKWNPRWQVRGRTWIRIQNSCLSISIFFLWLSLILSGKYSNHICLTLLLLPISFKRQSQLSQPPASVLLLKAIRFTFPLFDLKKSPGYTKDFSLLLFPHLPETALLFPLKTLVYLASLRDFSQGRTSRELHVFFCPCACSVESGAWSR